MYLVPGGIPGPRGCLLQGVYLVLVGMSAPGGVLVWGVCLLQGGIPGQVLPPPRGQTDACKLVTLPQISFAGGKNELLSNIFNADTPTVHWPVVLQFMSSDG